ncbi:MAG: sugar phosphate isomerase/epimerase family protein [Phycisphaerales bacterium]
MNVQLDRRVFMGAAVAGLAGVALGSSFAATQKQRWIKKALKVGMIQPGETIGDKFKIAAEAGFDGIELDSPGPYNIDDVLAAKDSTELEVPGVVLSTHWSKPFNHPDQSTRDQADQSLAEAIRYCKAVGGTSVLVVPAVVNQSMPYADAYTQSQAAMKRAAPLAQELDISIAFENVWNNFLLSPLEAARYSDELNDGLDRHVFGWHFDIGNIVNYGWPEQWIDTLAHRVIKIDVKDFSRSKRNDEGLWKGFRVKIGDGESGWDRVRDSLHRIGYSGWAAAEVGGGDLQRLSDIAQRMDRVFDQA